MRKKILILSVLYALLIGILTWYILSPENSEWLRIETPSIALQDQKFNLRVTLLDPEPGIYLSADLHWMTGEKESHGFLSGIKPVKITEGKNVYDLSIPVRKKELARFVFPVVFLSRDGAWSNHTVAAEAEPVPLLNSKEDISFSPLETKSAHDITKYQKTAHPESAPLRFIVAGLWFAVAVIGISAGRYLNTKIIASAALISALWEIFNSSSLSGNLLRYIAWFAKAYNDRREPQQITTILVVVVFALISLYLISSLYKKGKIIIWTSLLIFWTVSLLRVLSLHEVDTLMATPIAGFAAGQMIKLGASLLCLAGIMTRFFKLSGRNINTTD